MLRDLPSVDDEGFAGGVLTRVMQRRIVPAERVEQPRKELAGPERPRWPGWMPLE
jgi:hypothetical protein